MKTKIVFLTIFLFVIIGTTYGQSMRKQMDLNFQKAQWAEMKNTWNNNEKIMLITGNSSDKGRWYSDAENIFISTKFKHNFKKSVDKAKFFIIKKNGTTKKVCSIKDCSGYGYIVLKGSKIIQKIYTGSEQFYLVTEKETGRHYRVKNPNP
jgi:hypothetical protein